MHADTQGTAASLQNAEPTTSLSSTTFATSNCPPDADDDDVNTVKLGKPALNLRAHPECTDWKLDRDGGTYIAASSVVGSGTDDGEPVVVSMITKEDVDASVETPGGSLPPLTAMKKG